MSTPRCRGCFGSSSLSWTKCGSANKEMGGWETWLTGSPTPLLLLLSYSDSHALLLVYWMGFRVRNRFPSESCKYLLLCTCAHKSSLDFWFLRFFMWSLPTFLMGFEIQDYVSWCGLFFNHNLGPQQGFFICKLASFSCGYIFNLVLWWFLHSLFFFLFFWISY